MATSRPPLSQVLDGQLFFAGVEQAISDNDLTFLEGSSIFYKALEPGEAIGPSLLEVAQRTGNPIYINRYGQWSVYGHQKIGNQYFNYWQEAPLLLTDEQRDEMSKLVGPSTSGTIRNRDLTRPLIEALKAAHPQVESPIRDFMAQLERDYDRGYLKADNIREINMNMLPLIQAVRDLDAEEVQKRIKAIDKELVYSRPVRTKWAAIGLAIGAFIEGVAMVAIAILTKGTAIPALFMCLNIVSAGAVGALVGYKVAQRKANQKFDVVATFCNRRIWHNNRELSILAKKIGALYAPAQQDSPQAVAPLTKADLLEKVSAYLREYRAANPSVAINGTFMEKLFAIEIPVQEPPSLLSSFTRQTFYKWMPLGDVEFIKEQKAAIANINLAPVADEKEFQYAHLLG